MINSINRSANLTAKRARGMHENAITGIRLEVIHFLRTPLRRVQEVLSEVSQAGSADAFFRDMSLERKERLFLQQMARILRLDGSYTLNLSVSMLADAAFIRQLAEQAHQRRIIIEIQDPGSLLQLGAGEQQQIFIHVKRLINTGYRVWLDDLYPEHLLYWCRSGIDFDAVKIDAALFKKLALSNEGLAAVVRRYRDIGRQVVVEGVETIDDYVTCLHGAADAIQGYFFKSQWVSLPAKTR